MKSFLLFIIFAILAISWGRGGLEVNENPTKMLTKDEFKVSLTDMLLGSIKSSGKTFLVTLMIEKENITADLDKCIHSNIKDHPLEIFSSEDILKVLREGSIWNCFQDIKQLYEK